MDWINHLVLNHLLASHGVVVALAIFASNIDRLIKMLLGMFSKEDLEAGIDKLDALAKKEIEKVANQPK